jgi:hypothetical protein
LTLIDGATAAVLQLRGAGSPMPRVMKSQVSSIARRQSGASAASPSAQVSRQ